MSGLLALFDDIAAIAKLAAAQADDIAAQAAKAGAKTAGVVVDDAAVTPKYVRGLPAARELPIVLQIARGSLFNKLVILLPAALLLSVFAPFLLTPLLMLGGCYLCFEGAEKVFHAIRPHETHHVEADVLDAAHLEKQRVAGAIKTDFILSAEIMTIALSAIEADSLWMRAIVLAVVAIAITVVIYGAVAALVKADDVGLRMAKAGRLQATRSLGQGIVHAMPGVIKWVSIIGTAAMLWVGGSIILHGLKAFGVDGLYGWIHGVAVLAASATPGAHGFVEWFVTATLDGVFGLAVGLVLIPLVTRVITPAVGVFRSN